MRNTIEHLFYFITTLCNGKCKFCSSWRIIDGNKEQNRLSLKEIDLISKKIGRLKTVSISGGEPFLREDFVDICNTIYVNTKLKALSIPTNSLLPEKISKSVEKIAAYCNKSFIVIELPLDGVYNHYDEIRGIRGGFEMMKETFFRLRTLRYHYRNLHIKFNITYSYYNKNLIKEILDAAKSIFGNLDFTLGLIHGEPRYNEAKQIDVQDYFGILNEIFRRKEKRRIKNLLLNSVRKVTNKELEKRLLKKRPTVKCLATENFVVLSYDGEIHPCEPLSNISLGNLRDFNLNLSDLLSQKNLRFNTFSVADRKNCICDWSCGISRSLWSSKSFFIRIFSQLLREILSNF